MGRTPSYDYSTLPKWAKERLEKLEYELEEALGWCDNLENVLEDLTKEMEERTVQSDENETPCPSGDSHPACTPDGVQRQP